jgi:hypothetical protein
MTTAPADWYPDPQQPTRLRYWDGAGWTGYLVDPGQPAVVRYERPPWAPYVPGGINWPVSMAVMSGL